MPLEGTKSVQNAPPKETESVQDTPPRETEREKWKGFNS